MYTIDNVSIRTARLSKLLIRNNTRRFFGLGWLSPFVLEVTPATKKNAVGGCRVKSQGCGLFAPKADRFRLPKAQNAASDR